MIKQSLINGGGALGSAGASALGMPGSAAAMNGVGRALGARISRLIGSGDYASNSVSANSLIKPTGLNVQSSFGGGLGSLRIKHREYIGDIATGTSAGVFSNNAYPINPGLSNTFPFLSSMAQNYDTYVFHGLVFEFVSTTAGTASGAMGSIILSADYNSSANPYVNKHVMENSGYAVSSRLDGNVMYGIECAKSQTPPEGYLVRNSSSVTDKSGYDMALFQVATAPSTGFGSSAIVGELWVTYDVELRRPSLSPNRYGYARFFRTGVSAATPMGTASSSSIGYGACLGVAPLNSTKLEFQQCNAGDIMRVDLYWTGSVAGATTYPTLTYSGCSAFASYLSGVTIPAAGTSSTGMHMSFNVLVDAVDPLIPSVTLSGTGVYPTTSANCNIVVSCLGSGFLPADL